MLAFVGLLVPEAVRIPGRQSLAWSKGHVCDEKVRSERFLRLCSFGTSSSQHFTLFTKAAREQGPDACYGAKTVVEAHNACAGNPPFPFIINTAEFLSEGVWGGLGIWERWWRSFGHVFFDVWFWCGSHGLSKDEGIERKYTWRDDWKL